MTDNIAFHQANYGTQIGISYGTVNIHKDPPLVALQGLLASAPGASYDSKDAEHEELCLPGTRVEVLREIQDWVSSDQSKCIFWLCGMAGTGKSTISRSVAHSLDETHELGASFFFKRGEADRGNAKRLFPTIAKQMACKVPGLLSLVSEAAIENPYLAEKGLNMQFDDIIIKPLQRLTVSARQSQTVIVIVIDALDECEGDNDIRLVIKLLPRLQEISTVRLRVLVTSRPDLPLRLGFRKLADDDHKDLILHEIPRLTISNDISLYLNHQIKQIRDERDFPLPRDWPGQTAIQQLVDLSIPLFIFAATICRLFREDYWHPDDALREVLAQRERGGSQLDGTYLPILRRILSSVPDKRRGQVVENFQQIVGTIVLLESPLSVSSLSKLLHHTTNDIRPWLSQLHSVLRVPESDNLPIRLFHLSFRDYLLDPETLQNTPLGVNKQVMNYQLTLRCFHVCQRLHKNICGLPSDGAEHTDIDPQVIEECLAPELQYACRYWSHHLLEYLSSDEVPSAESDNLLGEALMFLERYFLNWLEAMSLLRLLPDVISIINVLQRKTPSSHPALAEFLLDARYFILRARKAAETAPLQIYCAALVFAPETAVRRAFKSDLPSWMTKTPPAVRTWGMALHISNVNSRLGTRMMEFSPDSRFLAVTGAADPQHGSYAIHVLDTNTGVLQAKFNAHGAYSSMAFNSNETLLLTTKTGIEIWDILGGTAPKTLEDYSVFAEKDRPSISHNRKPRLSFDGQFLVWICTDGNVQLWNVSSRTMGHKLNYPQSELVRMWGSDDQLWVSFSSDNSLVALAVPYGVIWLWDVQTGHLIHNRSLIPVDSLTPSTGERAQKFDNIVFSSDVSMLCCTGYDAGGEAFVYSLTTGELYQKLDSGSPFTTSTAFSPDNRSVAVGAGARINLFNSTTGEHYKTRFGHWDHVQNLSFSPDGRLLASASDDETVRIWDMQATHHLELEPDDYFTSIVESPSLREVIISRDAQLLVFVGDHSIELWEISSGVFRRSIDFSSYGFTLATRGVSISPDGSLLAFANRLDFVPPGEDSDDEEYPERRESMVMIWELSTDKLPPRYNHYLNNSDPRRVVSMVFSPDSQLLACNCGWNSIHLINAKAQTKREIEFHRGNDLKSQMAFSQDSQLLASTHQNGDVVIWDVMTGTLSHTLSEHSEQFEVLAFSPNSNKYLATSATASDPGGNSVVLWDLSKNSILRHNFTGHETVAYAAAISSDERLLVSACNDADTQNLSILRLWNIKSGFLLHTWAVHRYRLQDLRFSHDGSYVYSKEDQFKLELDPVSGLYSTSTPISIDDGWIRLNGVKSLLLPVEFEAFDYEIRENMLAIGHPNGRVSIFEFAV